MHWLPRAWAERSRHSCLSQPGGGAALRFTHTPALPPTHRGNGHREPPPSSPPQEGEASQPLPPHHLAKSGSGQQLFPLPPAPHPGIRLISWPLLLAPETLGLRDGVQAGGGGGGQEARAPCPAAPGCPCQGGGLRPCGPTGGRGAGGGFRAHLPGRGVCEAGSPRPRRVRDPGLRSCETPTWLGVPRPCH